MSGEANSVVPVDMSELAHVYQLSFNRQNVRSMTQIFYQESLRQALGGRGVLVMRQ